MLIFPQKENNNLMALIRKQVNGCISQSPLLYDMESIQVTHNLGGGTRKITEVPLRHLQTLAWLPQTENRNVNGMWT